MKIGLRDKLKTADFADPGQPLLERIGALYYRGQWADQPKTQKEVKRLLKPSAVQEPQETLLCLHAAILLAQHGEFDGIDFILELLKGKSRRDQLGLIRTALRNCSQFPLAVLLAQAIDLGSVNGHEDCLRQVMQLSDDDLFAYSERKDQQAYFEDLVEQLDAVMTLPRQPERDLAFGTIIRRPVRRDFGFRYTGFLAIERANQVPLIIPYDMGDVLNRNDQHAMQDVQQLLRQPGRRAIVVYDTDPPYEAQQLYILPFYSQTKQETQTLIARLLKGVDGLHIGVVVEISIDRGGYRIITADGQCRWGRYQPDRQKVGNCFLIHDLNSQPLSTRLRGSSEDVSDVARRFKQNTQLDRAIHVKTHHGWHTLASRQGNTLSMRGYVSDEIVYFVEEGTKDGKAKYYPFEVPGLPWTPEERSKVLSAFFAQQPDALGVILEVYEYKDNQYARIIHPESGAILRPRVNQDYPAGTLAFCEMGDDGNLHSSIMPGYRIVDGCPYCFGTSYRVCSTCAGEGRIVCPTCHGALQIECDRCGGTGKEPCGHCGGSGERTLKCTKCEGGYWRSGRICPKCKGKGVFAVTCRTCGGTKLWDCSDCHGHGTRRCSCGNGYISCPECGGDRVSQCECGGLDRGTIIAV